MRACYLKVTSISVAAMMSEWKQIEPKTPIKTHYVESFEEDPESTASAALGKNFRERFPIGRRAFSLIHRTTAGCLPAVTSIFFPTHPSFDIPLP